MGVERDLFPSSLPGRVVPNSIWLRRGCRAEVGEELTAHYLEPKPSNRNQHDLAQPEIRSTGRSLIPEGLESSVALVGMSDHIAFLLKIDD